MRRSILTLCTAAVVGLTSCAEHATHPQEKRLDSPRFTRIDTAVSVINFGANGTDGQSDRQAFQAAVTQARLVYVPEGLYHFEGTVTIPSDTRLYGAGTASVLRAVGSYWERGGAIPPAILVAYVGEAENPVTDVVVEHLSFEGEAAFDSTVAFHTRFGRRIRLNDVSAYSLGIAHVDNSEGVEVLRSYGTGLLNRPPQAIHLVNSRGVTVKDNIIHRYYFGIQWWGGQAKPSEPQFDEIKRTGNLTIDRNIVKDTESGIWGGNGEYIRVTNNTVEICSDVCLDAEGSDSVSFVGNTARYAGAGVLASYYFSSRILFANNKVEQDGVDRSDLPSADATSAAWTRMFWGANPTSRTSGLTVELRNNRYHFNNANGSTSKIGVLNNGPVESLVIDGDTLINTVIDMTGPLSGTVTVKNARITLNYNAGKPAIAVTDNFLDSFPWAATTTVIGNGVISYASQSSPGVYVYQGSSPYRVWSYIENNNIRGFSTAIRYGAGSSNHAFRITGNYYNGTISRQSGATPYTEIYGNKLMTGSGGSEECSTDPYAIKC